MATILDKTGQHDLFSQNNTFPCHPELGSGSHNVLILLDAETSSA